MLLAVLSDQFFANLVRQIYPDQLGYFVLGSSIPTSLFDAWRFYPYQLSLLLDLSEVLGVHVFQTASFNPHRLVFT